jgi:hypothetical protein
MSFSKAKELLKSMITDKTSPEDIEKFGNIQKEIEEEETSQVTFAKKYEDLRGKYVKAVMNSTFKADGKDPGEEPKTKTLNECVEEVISARKDA